MFCITNDTQQCGFVMLLVTSDAQRGFTKLNLKNFFFFNAFCYNTTFMLAFGLINPKIWWDVGGEDEPYKLLYEKKIENILKIILVYCNLYVNIDI